MAAHQRIVIPYSQYTGEVVQTQIFYYLTQLQGQIAFFPKIIQVVLKSVLIRSQQVVFLLTLILTSRILLKFTFYLIFTKNLHILPNVGAITNLILKISI